MDVYTCERVAFPLWVDWLVGLPEHRAAPKEGSNAKAVNSFWCTGAGRAPNLSGRGEM